jgi:hypothetical protein
LKGLGPEGELVLVTANGERTIREGETEFVRLA